MEIKEKIKERYGKIALFENTDSCCMPSCLIAVVVPADIIFLCFFCQIYWI